MKPERIRDNDCSRETFAAISKVAVSSLGRLCDQ